MFQLIFMMVIGGETYRKHCGYWLRTGSSYWRWIGWIEAVIGGEIKKRVENSASRKALRTMEETPF